MISELVTFGLVGLSTAASLALLLSPRLRSTVLSLLPLRLIRLWCPLSEQGVREVEGKELRTNTGWQRRIADPKLVDVLAVAYHYNPHWRPVADQVAKLGTR